MKLLEQLSIRTRALGRRAVGRVRPPSLPASLSLRLDDLDGPDTRATTLGLEGWLSRLVGLVLHTGALPTTVVGAADHPLLPELARFMNRLECPVVVRTSAQGLDERVALSLLDGGTHRFQVLDDPSAPDALPAALTALRRAGAARGRTIDVLAELSATRGAAFRERAAEARAAGADGVRLRVPWGGRLDPDALTEVRAWSASANRTTPGTLSLVERFDGDGPGAPRGAGRCPIATRRWELSADGTLSACPFKPGRAPLPPDGTVGDALTAHREAIAACPRECGHAALD